MSCVLRLYDRVCYDSEQRRFDIQSYVIPYYLLVALPLCGDEK